MFTGYNRHCGFYGPHPGWWANSPFGGKGCSRGAGRCHRRREGHGEGASDEEVGQFKSKGTHHHRRNHGHHHNSHHEPHQRRQRWPRFSGGCHGAGIWRERIFAGSIGHEDIKAKIEKSTGGKFYQGIQTKILFFATGNTLNILLHM